MKTFFDWLINIFGSRMQDAALARRLRALVRSGTVHLGEGVYGIPRVVTFRGNNSRLMVGAYASLTTGSTILLGGNHPTSWVSLYPFRARMALTGAYEDGMPSTKGDVIISADAWIGYDSLILSGVTVGVGAVVAARSVVTRSVPDYAIVAGNPAKVVRYRFSREVRDRLLSSRWWDFPAEVLKDFVPLLSSDDHEAFLDAVAIYKKRLTDV